MVTGSDRRGRAAVQPARNLRIPPTAADQLSGCLHWLDLTNRGRLGPAVIAAAMRHHRTVGTEPSILIATAVHYLMSGADAEPDRLNRFWHIADQVSARSRARYLNTEEIELQ